MIKAQIKYASNPYTSARVSAMKSLLLKRHDYDKLMKMNVSEILKFLQEGVYKEEINALAMRHEGLDLVEHALNMHLTKIFLKLKMISDPDIELLINQYLRRYDYWNVKVLLRAKLSGNMDFEDMLIPAGNFNLEKLKGMADKDVRDILKMLKLKDYDTALTYFENTGELSLIENIMDYHYYKESIKFAKLIPKQGRLFLEFFRYEFDIHNLRLILKKIYFNLDKQDIEHYLISYGKHLRQDFVDRIKELNKLGPLLTELRKTPYKLDLSADQDDILMRAEIEFQRFLLQRSQLLFHQNCLSVDVVLGYMFAKEIEVRNIRAIVKSKKFEDIEDYVGNLIVLPRN
ncbi:V-type ATPase subunit [Candidatus Woesearchaeota archaeon]|nr:V-type ATPase subunit [Candidatus Woesearchaeota archaeon]